MRRALASERKFGGGLLDFHLPDSGWAALVEVIRSLEAGAPQLHGKIASEHELGSLLIEAVATTVEAGIALDDVTALARAVEERLALEPDRWVVVPLANVAAPDRVVVLDTDGSGTPRAILAPSLRNLDDAAERKRAARLEGHLAHATGIRSPWLRSRFTTGPYAARDAPGSDGPHTPHTDSRVGAVLILRQSGPRRLAQHRALTEARFAVAVWCLANSPFDQHDSFALWPTVAAWQPQPYVAIEAVTISIGEHGAPAGSREGGEIEFGEYVLATTDHELALPWRALAAGPSLRPARALLSTAWALYLAQHASNEMQITDRVMHLVAAREAMCTPPASVRGTSMTRWQCVARRFRLYERLDADIDVRDVASAATRVAVVRDLTVHAGDAYSLLSGAPIDSTRLQGVNATKLVHATTRADAALAVTAIGRVAAGLLRAADAAGYEPATYEAYFS